MNGAISGRRAAGERRGTDAAKAKNRPHKTEISASDLHTATVGTERKNVEELEFELKNRKYLNLLKSFNFVESILCRFTCYNRKAIKDIAKFYR